MDTNGTLFFSKKTYKDPIYPTIELRTCSVELAKQLQTLLTTNGFRARIRGNQKEGFHVALHGTAMLTKWATEVGFSNPKHGNKIKSRNI
jgi:hypothetical protein